jgi:hypothetical protein
MVQFPKLVFCVRSVSVVAPQVNCSARGTRRVRVLRNKVTNLLVLTTILVYSHLASQHTSGIGRYLTGRQQ